MASDALHIAEQYLTAAMVPHDDPPPDVRASSATPADHPGPTPGIAGVMALIYALLGVAGLALALPPGYASPVFPAAGFAFAIALHYGKRILPAVWLGSCALNIGVALVHQTASMVTVAVAMGIATGAVLQAWAGWALVRRRPALKWRRLDQEKDILLFLALGGPLACLISATCGVLSLAGAGLVSPMATGYAWWNWYVGDTLGVLAVAPLTLALLQRRDASWRARLKAMALPVSGVLVLVTATFFAAARWEAEGLRQRVAAQGSLIADAIENRLIAHHEVLASMARFIEITPDLNAAQFNHLTVTTLHDQPDLFALSFNPYVTHAQRQRFEDRMANASVRGHYQITERGADGQLVRAAERPDYVAVAYIGPEAGNVPAIGFDINADPVRRDAIERARRSGRPAATAPLRLVQEDQPRVGVLVLAPAYRGRLAAPDPDADSLIGFAVAVIKVDDMIRIATERLLAPGVEIALRDPAAEAGRRVVYRSDPQATPTTGAPVWTSRVSMADRMWELRLTPTERFMQAHRPWVAWAVGVVGLSFAALLQVLLLAVTGRAAMVQRRVDAQTAALEKSEERYRSVIESVQEVIFQTDAQGLWTFLNPAWVDVTGFSLSESLGAPFLSFVHPDDRDRTMALFEPLVQRKKAFCRHEVRYLCKDGGHRWMEVFARLTLDRDARILGTSGTLVDITDRKLAEESLRASESALRQAQTVAQLGSWELDTVRGTLVCSDEIRRLFGMPDDIPLSLDRLAGCIHHEDRPRVVRARDDVLAGIPYDIEHRILVDNRILWVRERAELRYDGTGDPISALGTVQDITETKQLALDLAAHREHLERLVQARTAELRAAQAALAQENERFRMAVEAAPMAILMTDAAGAIVLANPALERMFGYAPGDLLGRTVDILVPSGVRMKHASLRQHYHRAPAVRPMGTGRELTGVRRDGSPFPVEIGLGYVSLGAERMVLAAISDITDHVTSLAHQESARLAAEAASRAKSSFLANMSHEIRTPLNAISGMAYLIRREPLSAQQRERLDKLDAAGRHLVEVINAILELSKIESGKYELTDKPFDLGDMLGRVTDMLQERIHAQHLRFSVSIDVAHRQYIGDATRLQQALLNYANNAVKFTERGTIALRVRAEEDGADEALLRFEIEDTGIGIAADVLDRLFSPFEQADNSSTRKYGGTGLGLVITKKIAELMAGTAGAASVPGQGSTFWFTARLKKARHPEAQAVHETPAEDMLRRDFAGRRILLVEDEPLSREIAQAYLEDVGLQVAVACNGVEAVRMAAGHDFDLILMDLKMPEMDGLAATRAIRQSESGRRVPIVALTANVFAEDRASCRAAGMVDFVAKPVQAHRLYDVLLRQLGAS